jgi:hypothetical protein
MDLSVRRDVRWFVVTQKEVQAGDRDAPRRSWPQGMRKMRHVSS